ncbi:MAG: hypothetical protein L6U99_06200 [Clostridium sp.]|nr:MAG: hypothetical protein L6U99_06200 [Clostridium sp.]
MSKIKIYGGKYLSGTIRIHGSKNACLPIMCASLLNKGKATIGNVPKIADVYNLLNIFSYLNVSYTFADDLLVIDSSKLTYKDLLIDEVLKFRASYYLIGVFLALFLVNVGYIILEAVSLVKDPLIIILKHLRLWAIMLIVMRI